jgi:hypothetical protein
MALNVWAVRGRAGGRDDGRGSPAPSDWRDAGDAGELECRDAAAGWARLRPAASATLSH